MDDDGAPPARSRWPCSPAVAGWLLAHRPASQTPAAVIRLSIPSVEPLSTLQPFGVGHLAISPDGSRVAYASASRLLIRQMGQKEAIAIEVEAMDPFFSPNGDWVGFFGLAGGETGLKKVPALGGTPVPIVATSERPGGGTWRADGTIVFATSEGLYQVSENGGTPRLLVKPDPTRKERAYAWPQFLPDGRSVLFTMVQDEPIEGAQLAVLDVNTLETKIVLKGGSAARYASTGHLVYTSGQTLKAIAFDPDTRRIRGDPVSLPDIAIATAPDNGAAEFAVSETGTLLFITPDRAWPAAAEVGVGRPSGKGRTPGARAGSIRQPAHLTGRHPRGSRHSRRQSGYLDLEPPAVEPHAVDQRADRRHHAGVEPGQQTRVLRIGPERDLRRVLASR